MAHKNIVILGASWGGLQSAHYFLKHVYPTLPKDGQYRVILVNPSHKHYWRIAGVRLIVSKDFPQDKYFPDIPSHFTHYPAGSFEFIEGSAVGLDTDARTVNLRITQSGAEKTLNYHALVLATGISVDVDGYNSTATEESIKNSFADLKAKIWASKSIIVGGGGPTAVETAGEIGSALNGEPGFFGWLFGGPNTNPNVPVTVITADKQIIPMLKPALGKRAEGFLNKLGVSVRYNSRIESVHPSEKGPTTVTLANGESLTADLYIPAIGARPNTEFLPPSILTERNFVNSTGAHRVPSAGPRVFAVGEVSGHLKQRGIFGIASQVPVVMTNLQRDLLAYTSTTDEKANIAPGPDREWIEEPSQSQLVPIGRSKGVAAAFGWTLPTFLSYYAKGKDFMAWNIEKMMSGGQVAKESKWTPK